MDTRLRQIHARAEEADNEELRARIAACYYLITYPSKDLNGAWQNLTVFHGYIVEIHDEQLDSLNQRLENEVIKALVTHVELHGS